MRLGIDYRLLASRENLVNRGIGRYTQQQLTHVLAADAENEYLLLCPAGADTSLVLPEIRSAPNVSFRFEPPSCAPPAEDPYERRGMLRRAGEYQEWVHGLEVDLYHSTAPFVLEQTAPPTFDACPMVATVYDLIPLIFPARYLDHPGRRAAYAGAARLVSSATRLLAISDGTRHDAAQYLGFPRESIDCAWPFADACFRPLDPGSTAAVLGPLGLPERFVLTVAALHHTKNLELLFAAYALLSPAFRRSLPLVVSCHLDPVGAAHVRQWAGTFGVADDVVLTGYVTDEQLAALYNRATLVAHPSRYEGFGLPVVEAMQCGAAVVTTTAPSLPEIAAGAAVFVDPDDAVAMAAAIDGLAGDPDRRRCMGDAGRVRAADFTSEALARATLASYRATVAEPLRRADRRRVAFRCPGPPPAGVLLPDLEVFTDDECTPVPEEVLDRAPVHHADSFDRCGPFDVVIDDDDGLGVADPCAGRPALAALLARARLGWAGLTAVTLDVDDERLLASDVVVDLGPAPRRRDLLRAAGAGKPLILGGGAGASELPVTFCDQVDDDVEAAERLGALTADPAAYGRRSAAARTWFERETGLDRRWELPADATLDALCQAEDLDGLPAGAGATQWSMALSRLALERAGLLGRDRRILALGEPGLPLAFDLSNHVAEVTAAGPWLDGGGIVGRALMVDPVLAATGPFEAARLVVRHVDPRRLPLPDAGVDAVLACRAIDTLDAAGVASAVAEMARVVKPGGLVALSVAVRLHGPSHGPAVSLADVIAGIGALEPVDPVRTTLSPRTRAGRRNLAAAVGAGGDDDRPLRVAGGALLGCLQLTLRKPGGHSPG